MARGRTRYDRLRTEAANPRTRGLDAMGTAGVLAAMNREDRGVAAAVGRVLGAVARGVDRIATGLAAGGRLLFVGAGTSGRLGVLEAAECPPTFGTSPDQILGVMAGGETAVFRSREGAEDDRKAGAAEMRRRQVGTRDVVAGIAASGVTPFVLGALAEARRRRATTLLVTCNPPPRSRPSPAEVVIAPQVGPEVLAGSTRLKAGTATKMVLNMLTLAAMVRLGKVYGNRMVDLRPSSRKLRDRAERIVAWATGADREQARGWLRAAGGEARVAVVIGLAGVDAAEARRRLERTGGQVRPAAVGSAKTLVENPRRRGKIPGDRRTGRVRS